MIFHAPQVIYLVRVVMGLTFIGIKHGKPKTGYESFWSTLIGVIIQILIIWWGGFFG